MWCDVPIEKSALKGLFCRLRATGLASRRGGDLDQDSTSCSLLHSFTVSGILISVLGTGDVVRQGVTDSSATRLLSASKAVED